MNKQSLSIILTVHNKDWLIRKVIDQIYKTTIGNYELVFVIDGCTDQSEHIINNMMQIAPSNVLCKKTTTPDVFETRANNAGMKICSGDYITIVQDDMIIKELGWNERMMKPFHAFNDVFAVTARTAHNWQYNPNTQHEHLAIDLDDCWCDIVNHTEHKHRDNTPRDIFAIRSCVNRGPLMLDHSVMQTMNYLPEDKIEKQDMDDHYLCYDVYKKLGKVCGLYWIDFESQDSWGGTRVGGMPAKWLLKANHKNMKTLWNDHKDIIGERHNEERNLK